MTHDTNTIEIENIGPIEHASIQVKPGGITVLSGPNGCGKSTVLQAVSKLQTERKDIRLTSRDGTVGGSVDGLGVRIKLTRNGNNKLAGECEVPSIEGDLSISDFVDPGIKNDDAADSKRIKSIIALLNAEADEGLFHSLLPESSDGAGDGYDAIVDSTELEDCGDLLELSSRIKRQIENEARRYEENSKEASSDANALKELIADIDTDSVSDASELETVCEDARDVLRGLESKAEWSNTNREAYSKAKERLESDCVDVNSLQKEMNATVKDCDGVEDRMVELRTELESLAGRRDSLSSKAGSLEQQIKQAESSEQDRASLKELVDKFEADECPTTEQFAEATEAYERAKSNRDAGISVREAIAKKDQIAVYEERKEKAENRAEFLRDAAKKTQNVLAEVVKGSCEQLRVSSDFRLIVDHAKRGECYFSELSEGERWKIGIEIALSVFAKKGIPGLLQIPQHCWEALDGDNRTVIREAIAGTDLAIITAEASRETGSSQKSLFVETD